MPSPAARRVSFRVAPEHVGLRLDQLLAANVPDLSRRQARVLLEIGGVFVDGARVKIASRTLRAGQSVQATLGTTLAKAAGTTGRTARARDDAALPAVAVVHEDDDALVVDKPSGLLVAATAETDRGHLVAVLQARASSPHVWLVHRLDAATSGLMALAKTQDAARTLSQQFSSHTVERAYLATAHGAVPDGPLVCRDPIGGKHAVTHIEVDERHGALATRVRCRLETGRTHQIRIHLKHLGHPVFGDRVHGAPAPGDAPRLALHATLLGFAHPRTGAPLRFTSPWPTDLAEWTARLAAQGASGCQ